MAKRTLYGTVIVTYRCNARCNMCDCFKDPTRPEEEITLEDIKKLPEMAFTNITGGEVPSMSPAYAALEGIQIGRAHV